MISILTTINKNMNLMINRNVKNLKLNQKRKKLVDFN